MKLYDLLAQVLETKYDISKFQIFPENIDAYANIDTSLPLRVYLESTRIDGYYDYKLSDSFSIIDNIFSKTPNNDKAFQLFVKYIRKRIVPKLITKRSKQHYPGEITVIGLGGVGFNLLYNLYRLRKFSLTKWNPKIKVYEDDCLEWHNIPRLPIQYPVFDSEHCKIEYAKYLKEYLNIRFYKKRWSLKDYDGSIVIGAPDLRTRREIVENNIPHLFILHQNDEFYIKRYKTYHALPITETYGTIDVCVLAFGVLIATLLLPYLFKKEDVDITYKPRELFGKIVEIEGYKFELE